MSARRADPGRPLLGGLRARLGDLPWERRPFRAVVGIAAVALLARLVGLGTRIAHWDEGRVAFWALRYAETGYFEYRAIVHGPFLFQVDRWLFVLLGPSDFAARLPVAVVGGLLPLVAWLLHERLRDTEVVALAALLAFNPLLLYYSRFARNDVLVAAFCTAALAFLVRTYDTRRPRAVYAAGALLALGVTAKENALLYLACWGGAGALLLDHRLLDAVRAGETRAAVDGRRLRAALRSLDLRRAVPAAVVLATAPPVVARVGYGLGGAALVALGTVAYALLVTRPLRYAAVVPLGGAVVAGAAGTVGVALPVDAAVWHVLGWLLAVLLIVDARLFAAEPESPRIPPALGGFLLFFAVVVLFYAPRSGPTSELGLWRALRRPTLLPLLLDEAVVGSWEEFRAVWAPAEPFGEELLSQYPGRLATMGGTLRTTAPVVAAFSVLGVVADRWSGAGPRDVVAFAGYWGVASVLGYPYATDIWAPWVAVHAVVPLAIPAAVGLAAVYRVGVRAWRVPTSSGRATDDGLASADAVLARLGPYARAVSVLAAAVLLVAAVPVAVTGVDLAYLNADGHERVLGPDEPNEYALQWAQPGTDLRRSLRTVARVSAANEGTDVLFVGSRTPGRDPVFFMPAEDVCERLPPVHHPVERCDDPDRGNWHSRLPLPWYLQRYGATVDSTPPDADIITREEFPPVVIAYGWDRNRVTSALPDSYVATSHRFKLWSEDVVVFVDRSEAPA